MYKADTCNFGKPLATEFQLTERNASKCNKTTTEQKLMLHHWSVGTVDGFVVFVDSIHSLTLAFIDFFPLNLSIK